MLFIVLFAVPTFASFYFSLTRWTLFDTEFIGLENYKLFFTEPMMVTGFVNTFIYGVATSAAKVVLGLALGILLTAKIIARGYLRSVVFFPVLVSTIGVGITFKILLDPFDGVVNRVLALVRGSPGRAGSPTRTWPCGASSWSTSGRVWASPR